MTNQKPTIKIKFSNFWEGFRIHNNSFEDFLTPHFNLDICEDADFLIYSCFGNSAFRDFKGIRIFYTGENVRPDFNECDFALSFDYLDDPRHIRFPNYVRNILNEKRKNPALDEKRKNPKVQLKKPSFAVF